MTDKTCATCKNWKPRDSGDMVKLGIALCAHGPRWKFFPPQSSCVRHEAAAADEVEFRAALIRGVDE